MDGVTNADIRQYHGMAQISRCFIDKLAELDGFAIYIGLLEDHGNEFDTQEAAIESADRLVWRSMFRFGDSSLRPKWSNSPDDRWLPSELRSRVE